MLLRKFWNDQESSILVQLHVWWCLQKKSQILMCIMFKKALTYPWNISSFHPYSHPKWESNFFIPNCWCVTSGANFAGEKNRSLKSFTGHVFQNFTPDSIWLGTLYLTSSYYFGSIPSTTKPRFSSFNFVKRGCCRLLPPCHNNQHHENLRGPHTPKMPCPQEIRPS